MEEQEAPVEHRPKRARVGRPPEEILLPIQRDVRPAAERTDKQILLELLVYLGRPKRNESLVDTLKPQTTQLSHSYRFNPEITLTCMFEW